VHFLLNTYWDIKILFCGSKAFFSQGKIIELIEWRRFFGSTVDSQTFNVCCKGCVASGFTSSFTVLNDKLGDLSYKSQLWPQLMRKIELTYRSVSLMMVLISLKTCRAFMASSNCVHGLVVSVAGD